MSAKIVIDGQTVDLSVSQEEIDAAVDAKVGDINAVLDAINNGSSQSPSNLRNITTAVQPEDAGTVTGGGYASDGVVMSLSANLAEGYSVDHWEKDGVAVSSDDRYDLTVDGDASVTAVATQYQYLFGRDWRFVPIGDGATKYNCRQVAYGHGVYVMAIYDSTSTDSYLYSLDGISWEIKQLPISGQWYALVYSNGIFIMENRSDKNKWLKSSDGLSWNQISVPIESAVFNVVYAKNGTAYFVSFTTSDTRVYATENGVAWRMIDLPLGQGSWMSTAELNGRRIVIASNSNAIATYLYTDDGGETWSIGTLPKLGNYRSVVTFQDKFVLISSDGNSMLLSEDGITWTDGDLPTNIPGFVRVVAGNRLSCLGSGNVIESVYETVDLSTWTSHDVPYTNNRIRSVSLGYSFDNIAIVPLNANAVLVSYSTNDPPPEIPTLAANTLSLDDEEEVSI